MYLSDREAKDLILEIGRNMSNAGFVAANDGNLSVRCGKDEVWITPTGVNKGELKDEMLIKVRISDSAILEGTWKPTSETEMHLNAYRTDDEIVSTAHAHPLNCSILACAGIELDLPTTLSAVCICGRIPVIPYCCSGSRELAECIIPYVKKYHVVNLANHGPIAWGKSPREAWYRLQNAEASARLALGLASLGRLRPINSDQITEALAFHGIDMTPEGTVCRVDSTADLTPAIPFSEFMRQLMEKK